MCASENGHDDIVALLLKSGVSIDLQSETGATALMLAAWNGHVDAIQALISQGGQFNLIDKEQWNPLILRSRWKATFHCAFTFRIRC